MYRVLIVEDEKVIRKGIIYVVDWAAFVVLLLEKPKTGSRDWT